MTSIKNQKIGALISNVQKHDKGHVSTGFVCANIYISAWCSISEITVLSRIKLTITIDKTEKILQAEKQIL